MPLIRREKIFREELKLEQHVKGLKTTQKNITGLFFSFLACWYNPEIGYVADKAPQEYAAGFFSKKWGSAN
jgi:hypothetical protein